MLLIKPLLVVPKKVENKKEKWGLVADFRPLNNNKLYDKFPLTKK